ncbi:proton extrusion protein PcxA [Oscillatoria sp. CS-180]|uniref:proton extrusion protein PcxA n=1 Tax=Oscillatoria sp. CS-180 TaxID=3021720 RepID=UPI00232C6450|nr:proton extrusion protein PcxA [Oscillatoria sp. CS-180]MDB9529497.1 proton extrusion protein PcxA [Oscillatoria sp. CS-180]
MGIPPFLRKAQQWFFKTPERSLDQAYEAARMIEAIENEHFDGNPISARYGNYGKSSMNYFEGELQKYLNLINLRMTEFRASSAVIRVSDPKIMEIQVGEPSDQDYTLNVIDRPSLFFRKLQFVDEVRARYRRTESSSAQTVVMVKEPATAQPRIQSEGQSTQLLNGQQRQASPGAIAPLATTPKAIDQNGQRSAGITDRASVLPRSILRTVDRIRQDLDPNAEEQVVKNFRSSRGRTTTAIRFLLLLVIVPLLTQQFAKNYVVGPIVDYARENQEADVFLNMEMEEEALHELQQYEERLRFEVLIGKVEPIREAEIEERVVEKATEIESEYRDRSADAVKNVFSDILAVSAFIILLTNQKRGILTLKSFLDEIVYGLSDSAKAFIIILFTDMFVGFHSPHGWEVLMEGLSRHLGFAANREFIFLFIATFPVILDTVFKYWIFRYLNRISPSAVATYKNMNE